MHYRIKFKAAPQEFVFEAMKHFVFAKDVVETVRINFNIYKSELVLYDENGNKLQESDEVENGRTYVVKRIPSDRVVRKRKRYWYR